MLYITGNFREDAKMKVTIESTQFITHIDGVPVRVWQGVTERGIPCVVFVHRVAVKSFTDSSEFDRELQQTLQPEELVDLRHIL